MLVIIGQGTGVRGDQLGSSGTSQHTGARAADSFSCSQRPQRSFRLKKMDNDPGQLVLLALLLGVLMYSLLLRICCRLSSAALHHDTLTRLYDSVGMLFWCMLSSCLGRPILNAMSELWKSILESARIGMNPSARRGRRTTFGTESDVGWEMETRRRQLY